MDRCDACHVAAALVVWWHPGCKGELHLCAHHAHRAEPRMLREGWQLAVDDREPARV